MTDTFDVMFEFGIPHFVLTSVSDTNGAKIDPMRDIRKLIPIPVDRISVGRSSVV